MDPMFDRRRQLALEELQSGGWLAEVVWLEEVDSTNSLARRRLLEGNLPLPALLIADRQTAGRGRTTRTWWSPSGCLMMSLVISNGHMPAEPLLWPQLSLVTGVAAAAAVEQVVPKVAVKLKWPNDLYIGHTKLAGVLVEAVSLGKSNDHPFAFIVGIGLNVAVDFSSAPPEIQQRACSLSQFHRQVADLEGVLVHVIDQLRSELIAWRSGESTWWQAWSQRSLLTGKSVHVRLPSGQSLIGQCEGIDQQGYLVLRDASGVYHLQSAEILHWD